MGIFIYLVVLFFILSCVSFVGYTGVLLWHWKQYSTGSFTTLASMTVYTVVGVVLIVLMLSALLRLASL